MAEPTPPQHYVVLIVLDAGRPGYLNLARLPHIHALMQQGVVYDRAWVGELDSSTPDVHVTFGTGTLPRENGFLGFGWAAPQTRRTVDFRTLLANGQIDPVLRALPVPSVAARLHQFFPNTVSVAASGHKDYAVVGLGGGAASYEIYGKFANKHFNPTFLHTPPPLDAKTLKSLTIPQPLKMGAEDDWAFKYVNALAQRVRPRLLMINLPELDTWGHWYGPDDQKVFRQLIQNVDRGIGTLEATYQRLGILNDTDFIITADHSMMESKAAHNWRAVQNLSLKVKARVVRADGESGSIWLQNPAQAQAVAEQIVKAHPAHVEAVFYRSAQGISYSYTQASPDSWLVSPQVSTALHDLVDTTAGRNGPDLWVLYHENYSVVPRNVAGTWKGTHGGATWKVQHVPLIMDGPGIRSGVHAQFPARAIDIAPTMEYLLGLPPIHRDGVVLADAFQHPGKAETEAEDAVAPRASADVIALQAQSKADTDFRAQWPSAPPSVAQCSFAPAVAIPPQRPCTIDPSTLTHGP